MEQQEFPGTEMNKAVRKELPQADTYSILRGVCDETNSVRLRYANMSSAFYYLVDENTRGEQVVFANFLARVDHLLRKNRPSAAGAQKSDYSMFSKEVHRLRYRISRIDNISDEDLEKYCRYDLRTLCRFTELLTKEKIPIDIKKCLPIDRMPETTVAVNAGYFRVIVDEVVGDTVLGRIVSDEMLPIKVLLKYDIDADNVDFTYLKPYLTAGAQINVVAPKKNAKGEVISDIIVYEPDYLIDITATASCFESCGVTPRLNLLSRLSPDAVSEHILLGNFAGQLLDEAVHSATPVPYNVSAKTFFRNYVSNLLAYGNVDREFHTMAKIQSHNIQKAVNEGLNGIPTYDKKALLLEPSFFCEMLGLQGRMDMLQSDMSILVEQKSGKAGWGSDDRGHLVSDRKHYIQILLYQALLHYGFGVKNGVINSFLLYSKYPEPLLRISNSPRELREAFRIRNLIAAQEISLGNEGFDILLRLTPEDFLLNERQRRFFDNYKRADISAVLESFQNAEDTAREYALAMLKFVQVEHLTAKTGFSSIKPTTGFASAWNTPVSEKRSAGDIIDNLTIKGYKTDEESGAITHVVLSKDIHDDVLPNFRTGDIVAMYYYVAGENPDVRRSVVVRADLESLQKDEITLKLRSPQGDERIFKTDKRHRVAIERDLYDSSYKSQYQGIVSLLNTDESRRQLVLSQRKPRIDRSKSLTGDYGDFNDLVLRSKRAEDIFVIIGPPGTGKTSHALLNIVKEELATNGTKLLLGAFTNRAVDEICSKLAGAGIDFVRIGSHLNCAAAWQPYLLKEAIRGCNNLQEISEFMEKKRVVAGTLQSINGSLQMLRKYHFTTSVIDEASQILEPHILPLLSARSDGGNMVDKFVFIGDHKQLPAIVVQPKGNSVVTNPVLNDIGLYDCRDSFFHRILLNNYDAKKHSYDPDVVYSLNHQGRMHEAVAQFASKLFYGGNLRPVPLKHQVEEIKQCEEKTEVDRLLNTSRMVLIDVKPTEEDLQNADNANRAEAAKVAEVIESVLRRTGNEFNPLTSVGVIVPYRSQIITIRKALERLNDSRLDSVVIDTVERFQGSQREYIIFSTTVKRLSQLNFLTDNRFSEGGAVIDRKLNVALTRTQSHSIIVCNKDLVSRDPIYKQLCKYCKE